MAAGVMSGFFGSGKSIVRDSLQLYLDAGLSQSYPGSGSTWSDLSGNARNSTLNGSPTFTSPGYFDITGDSTYISLSNSGLVPRTNDFTYSMWVRYDVVGGSGTYASLFENGFWTDSLLFRLDNGNGLTVFSEGAYIGAASWTPSINQWYNVVLSRSAGVCTIFVDNILMASFSMTTDINLANTQLWLMRSQHTTGQFTDGKISTFSIYSKALSNQESGQNFEALRGRFGK